MSNDYDELEEPNGSGKVIVWIALAFLFVLFSIGYAIASPDVRIPPPAKYDHEPTIPYTVYVTPLEVFAPHCPSVGRRLRLVSCSGFTAGHKSCIIFIRTGLGRTEYAQALRHEKALCNGWNDGTR